MKEFKGTPGPWKVNKLGSHWNSPTLQHIQVTFGEIGECVCDTVYIEEDANLIAAAPKLLKALQASLSIWETMRLDASEASVLIDCRAVIDEALGVKND